MKNFSDTNTTKQQERRAGAEFKMRVELLRQWSGDITERTSATVIKVSGDATALLAIGEVLVIPLDDFAGNHIITGISHAAGVTTITCAASTFATTVVGLQIAKRYTVSGGNTERMIEMSDIRFQVEGDTLNEFVASDVDLAFWNADGYFSNSAATGIFNDNAIMWVRIYCGWRYATDRILYFGGYVQRNMTKDDRAAKTYTITAFGHAKELERYPAWRVSNTPISNSANTGLVKLKGIQIIDIVADSGFSEGIRTLKFDFPARDNLTGLDITEMSVELKAGFHLIKFSPPNLFQFDYGDWNALSEGATDETLTDAKGVSITIDAPKSFGLRNDYLLFYVERDLNEPKLLKRGRATLQLEDGEPQDLIFDFENIVIGETDYTSYEVITDAQDDAGAFVYEVFDAGDLNQAIFFFSAKRFEGISFTLNSDLIGAITVEYSQGFNSWGNLSVTDGTNVLTQSGRISWDSPSDWLASDYELGAPLGTLTNMFAIRITLTAHTSGSVTLLAMKKNLRLRAKDFAVDVSVNLPKLLSSSATENFIVLEDDSVLSLAQWYSNISFQKVVESILAQANYVTAQYALTDLNYSLDDPVISLNGQPPAPFYSKDVTAICVDRSVDPNVVYLGIEDELWKVDDTNNFTFLDRLPGYLNSGQGNFRLKIRRIVIDGNGYLQGLAWKDYDEILYGDDDDYSQRTAALVFRSTDKLTITEATQVDETSISIFHSGQIFIRNGSVTALGINSIGQQLSTSGAGENIAIPMPQVVLSLKDNLTVHETRKAAGLLSDDESTASQVASMARAADRVLHAAGWYVVHDLNAGDGDVGELNVRFSFGQQGFVVWDEESDAWVCQEWQSDTMKVILLEYDGTISDHLTQADENVQLCAGCADGTGLIYASEMTWDDVGDSFPSDLSDCRLVEYDTLNPSSSTEHFNCASDSVEASQSLSGTHDGWDAIKSCTVIEMCYNNTEGTVHGCILDRYDLTYHWFVLDLADDKLYSSQTATNFDFVEGMQITGFVFNDEDDMIYAVATDRRYNEIEAFLVKADFDSGRAAGSEIQITKCDTILSGETTLNAGLAVGDNGRVYGVTGSKRNMMFQWDNVFFPRVFMADFGSKNMRQVINECTQVLNFVQSWRSDRTMRLTARSEYDGTKSLYEGKHIVQVNPLELWEHFYDRVEVTWRDPINGETGVEAIGTAGWERRVLTISNELIQYRQLAKVVAQQYFEFFNTVRERLSAEVIALLELEEYDRIRLVLKSSNTDIDRDDYWILTDVAFNPQALTMRIKGLK